MKLIIILIKTHKMVHLKELSLRKCDDLKYSSFFLWLILNSMYFSDGNSSYNRTNNFELLYTACFDSKLLRKQCTIHIDSTAVSIAIEQLCPIACVFEET